MFSMYCANHIFWGEGGRGGNQVVQLLLNIYAGYMRDYLLTRKFSSHSIIHIEILDIVNAHSTVVCNQILQCQLVRVGWCCGGFHSELFVYIRCVVIWCAILNPQF
jgi:hypothetical protein